MLCEGIRVISVYAFLQEMHTRLFIFCALGGFVDKDGSSIKLLFSHLINRQRRVEVQQGGGHWYSRD